MEFRGFQKKNNNNERIIVHRRHTLLIELICLFDAISFFQWRRKENKTIFIAFTIFSTAYTLTAPAMNIWINSIINSMQPHEIATTTRAQAIVLKFNRLHCNWISENQMHKYVHCLVALFNRRIFQFNIFRESHFSFVHAIRAVIPVFQFCEFALIRNDSDRKNVVKFHWRRFDCSGWTMQTKQIIVRYYYFVIDKVVWTNSY